MAKETLKNIFLSASVPLPERNPRYIETADVVAIRDAVIALVTTVIPKYRLIWGGHPSITPLVNYVIQKQKRSVQDYVLLYQSRFFEPYFPEDNNEFENIILTNALADEELSLRLMRETMFGNHTFDAGVFIGGMDGVETEFEMFRELQPEAKLIPLASTGAAAKIIFDNQINPDRRFLKDFAYSSIFQEYLIDKL